jgi:hypothetical protein
MNLNDTISGYVNAKRRLRNELPIARHRRKAAMDDERYWARYADKVSAEMSICEQRIGELTARLLTCGISHRRALRIIQALGV